MKYYAERLEDEWLDRSGILPNIGTYVDVGCNGPFLGNNCAFLRDRGWTGLNIDALDFSGSYSGIGAPFVRAIVGTEGPVRFRSNCNPSLARIDTAGELHWAVPLKTILRVCGIKQVDLLSLDLEGSEFDAYMTLGNDIPKVPFIIAEYATRSIEEDAVDCDHRLKQWLENTGYETIFENESNRIYRLK